MKSFLIALFNLKERLHHTLTQDEINLIKSTNMFSSLDNTHLSKILQSICLIKFQKDQLIFHEGQQEAAFYIIAEGSIRVFTYDNENNKIPIARLNKGDYFGEITLLGEARKTRYANIETITDTVLLQIDEKIITQLFKVDKTLKSTWTASGTKRALKILSATTSLYDDLEKIVSNLKNTQVIELEDQEILFNVGDKPDNVYVLLEGQIKLLLPIKNTTKFTSIIMHKGHLFGELGVINNKPRSGTVLAHGNALLLAIPGDELKRYLPHYPRLRQLISNLNQIYQLPRKGAVEQFIGSLKGMGTTLTNIYKLDDGRSVLSCRFLEHEIFSMTVSNVTWEKQYKYKEKTREMELEIANKHLINIKASGYWDELPALCSLLLNNEFIDDQLLANFEATGELRLKEPTQVANNNEIICECMSVTRLELQNLIDKGVKELDGLSRATGACTACRGCKYKILMMLGINPWLPAKMQKINNHTAYISSFLVQLNANSVFHSFFPGQHVIIQVKIGDIWIERPYTITNMEEHALRITIKREPKGLFTSWLYDESPKEFKINVSQPQGQFLLDLNDSKVALCFAGGVGITPFISFAKSLLENRSNKKMHLIYCALAENDFILKEEFNAIAMALPSFTILYRATDKYGLLKEEEIIHEIESLDEPDIYICGPEGFVQLLQNTLLKTKYDVDKIHLEQFVHAGGG